MDAVLRLYRIAKDSPLAAAFLLLFALEITIFVRNAKNLILYFSPSHNYTIPIYYISYSDGFARRGLPGALLKLVVGNPTSHEARVFGWLLTALAVAGVATIVLLLNRCSALVERRLLLSLIAATSSLSLLLVLADPGRYDDIGFVCVAGIALLAFQPRASIVAVVGLLTLATAVATLSEEFLFGFLCPVVLTCAFQIVRRSNEDSSVGSRLRQAARLSALPLGTGAVLLAWSVIAKPSAALVAAAQRASGHPLHELDAASALRLSVSGQWQLQEYYGKYAVITPAVWAVLFGLTCVAISRFIDRIDRYYWISAAYCACVGIVLSVIGIDGRRWWAMAFVTQLATTAIRYGQDGGGVRFPVAVSQTVGVARDNLATLVASAVLLLTLVTAPLSVSDIYPPLLAKGAYWRHVTELWIPYHPRSCTPPGC
jgi:hypothetical protein